MSTLRFNALNTFTNRTKIAIEIPSTKISDYYGEHVFSEKVQKEYLSKSAFTMLQHCINESIKPETELADQVANAMKAWAISKGATHYTHWFQPLNGSTAEKHEAFFVSNSGIGLEEFSGIALIQQEPDASSFPSGGIRATFEARGYSTWDIKSPAFIMTVGSGKTLCIPTRFVSYTGESLDFKTPLLKSIQILDEAATEVCNYFNRDVKKVKATLGWEQEYFLLDSAMYYARPDISLTGRSLYGRNSTKGKYTEDHYFGAIPERVYAFMRDFEFEAHKLGIPIRTRHNEASPSQYECAPMFEEANLSVDHNQLLMDIMDRISGKHKLKVLFHEKPFADLNGSSKHINWSLHNDEGKNLLKPGSTPRTNLQFLTFFINTIAAVNKHEALLRASIASHGNDYRLGADDAPPAILSVYIGKNLTEVLDMIEKRVDVDTFDEQENISLRLDLHNHIPEIIIDNTDSNRTSPFAFTGNKFEFRAVGSSLHCAFPLTVLNAIVAEQLIQFKHEVDTLIKLGDYKDVAILKVLSSVIKKSRRILFEGDNYSEQWQKEALSRGLSNNKNTPEALKSIIEPESLDLFKKLNILSNIEVNARYEIMQKNYSSALQKESIVLGELMINIILPTAVQYQNILLENILKFKNVGMDAKLYSTQSNICILISKNIDAMIAISKDMTELRAEGAKIEDIYELSALYHKKIKPLMEQAKSHIDELEGLIDDNLWPLPKHREMLFVK
jgi:glutamine synthetase